MSDRIFVATRKGLFTLTRSAAGWAISNHHFLGEPVSAILPDPRDRSLYAALNLGHFGTKLWRSPDRGGNGPGNGPNWQEITTPAYPPQPDPPSPEDKTPWKLELIWTLEAGGRDEPGALYAGTIPGGLFRSNDQGATWSLMRGLWDRPERLGWFGGGYDHPGIHSICVDPRDSAHVLVGISSGGVWSSRDRGGSWTLGGKGMLAEYMPPDRRDDPNIQDVHRLVQCRANPDELWVQHHSSVYRSSDTGASWQEIPNPAVSKFGFAVAVHPTRPETSWFVPAIKDERRYPVDGALAVTRTCDGGKTFEALRTGLPQAHAYDLIYRHGLDVDRTGERLVIGSTTGNLWVSENGGDAWQRVSTHLPPVNAVRFDI